MADDGLERSGTEPDADGRRGVPGSAGDGAGAGAGAGAEGGGRGLSGMSVSEFVRLARMRAGLDPEPPEGGEEVEATGGRSGEQRGDRSSGSRGPVGGVGPDRAGCRWPVGEARVGGLEAGVGRVVEALRGLVPPGGLDDGVLGVRVVDLVRLQSLVGAVLLSHLGVWDARGLWASDGSKSPSARLARDANCGSGSCRSWVWLGRALARMPITACALEEGRVSLDHVRRLAQACTDERLGMFLEAEEQLVGEAVRLAGSFRSFERVVAVWEQAADDLLHDPTDPDDLPAGERRRRSGRHCRLRADTDGFELVASLTRVGGQIVREELQRRYDELWRTDWQAARARLGEGVAISEADLGRSSRQRWADALVEMARRSGATRPGDQLPQPLITVHVTVEETTGPIRETFNGLVMSRRDVADLIADRADWERIIYGPAGQPVNLTSVQRNFTGALRRAVQLRDRVYSHPTCDVDAQRCQVDHIVEHSAGGPTHIDNARLLCPRHNRQRPGRGNKPPPRSSESDDSDGDGDRDRDGHG